MFRHLHPLGDSPRRSLAESGARVPKVLPTAELEGVRTWLNIAMPLEPFGDAAVGDDVEEAQELTVEAPACGDDAGQEDVLIVCVCLRERRLLLSWAKAERYSEESRKATRSEDDDLEESVQLARSCAMGGEDVVGEVKGVDSRAGGVGGRTIATERDERDVYY